MLPIPAQVPEVCALLVKLESAVLSKPSRPIKEILFSMVSVFTMFLPLTVSVFSYHSVTARPHTPLTKPCALLCRTCLSDL
jgi:hypothetical protein